METQRNLGDGLPFETRFQKLRSLDTSSYEEYRRQNPLRGTSGREIPELVVSLTSFPERIDEVVLTCHSLLDQGHRPDRVVLWLATQQFPLGDVSLPPRLLDLRDYGLEVCWTSDTRSYKKLIPALKAFPQSVIVTADDDIYYDPGWLGGLYRAHVENPSHIQCHRAHRVLVGKDGFEPYRRWPKVLDGQRTTPSYLNFLTGCGGVLYPPGCLDPRVTEESLFLSLAPTADDIWFWTMACLKGTKVSVVADNILDFVYLNPSRELKLDSGYTLGKVNNVGGASQTQLQAVYRAFPSLAAVLADRRPTSEPSDDALSVVFVTDPGYVDPTIVAIRSLVSTQTVSLSVYVVGCALDQEQVARLQQLQSLVPLKIIQEDGSRFVDYTASHGAVSHNALYKFELPHLLPHLDRVLYLDSDLLVLGDLSSLLSVDLDDYFAAVVPDFQAMVREQNRETETSRYFNSGVMLLNLSLLRQRQMAARLRHFKESTTLKRYMDQDAFNYCFGDCVHWLDPKFNLILKNVVKPYRDPQRVFSLSRAEYELQLLRPSILHFAGKAKPWKAGDPFEELYLMFGNSTTQTLDQTVVQREYLRGLAAKQKLSRKNSWSLTRFWKKNPVLAGIRALRRRLVRVLKMLLSRGGS